MVELFVMLVIKKRILMEENIIQQQLPTNREDTGRNPNGTFKKGVSGNPAGRPKNTLKDYVRNKFMQMSDEEKEKFLIQINPEFQWKMGEGNPESEIKTDITSGGGKIEINPITQIIINKFEEELRKTKC